MVKNLLEWAIEMLWEFNYKYEYWPVVDVFQSERLEEEHWQILITKDVTEYISRGEAAHGIAIFMVIHAIGFLVAGTF